MMYGLPPEGLMRRASCPKYHDYKHREQMAAHKARLAARKGNHGAGRKWAAAADQWRARASAALRECIEAAGHYGVLPIGGGVAAVNCDRVAPGATPRSRNGNWLDGPGGIRSLDTICIDGTYGGRASNAVYNEQTNMTHYCRHPCRGLRRRQRRLDPRIARKQSQHRLGHGYGGYGTMGDYTCEGCHDFGAYGGCGHCGTPACPDGQYGGCGTFFGKSKDETKRACWLEKKIAKHQECCARDCSWFSGKGNQSNQCAKVARAEAELLQLTGGEGGASDLSQQADAQLAMAFQQANAMSLTNAAESAKTDQMLGIAALAGGGLLLVMALR